MTRHQRLAITALVLGYLLVILGGTLRVNGLDGGCGADWPACNGSILPTLTAAAALHYTHRALAALVIALALGLVVAGLRARHDRGLAALSGLSFLLVLIPAGLGALAALGHDSALVATAHLGIAEAYLVATGVLALGLLRDRVGREGTSQGWTSLGRLSLAAAVAVIALILTGAYTRLSDAGAACTDWPLCGGRYFPTGWTAADLDLTHRWIALVATALVLAAAVQARRVRQDAPALIGVSTAAAVLMIAQIFVGAANVWFAMSSFVSVAHLAVATIVLGMLAAVAVLDRMMPVGAPVLERHAFRELSRDYAILTKPGVMTLLLTTTLCAMLFAQAGLPPLRILLWTLVGGALASGGAAALNHFLDRDIDEIMARTRRRPVPGRRIVPVYAAIFGITLSILSVYLLAVFVNLLAALLSLLGNLFYVFIYTKWLKRATPQNIVIGGVAGAIPPLVGWAAVTNNVELPALIMFAIIFYWTPPHFWALALFRSKTRDYAAAGVPMFPGVYGEAETRRQIFHYTLLLVGVSLFLFPLRVSGPLYLIAALVLGALFVVKARQLMCQPERQPVLARSLFMYSNYYLALLFTAMVVDRLVWF